MNALQYHELGLLEKVIAANIPRKFKQIIFKNFIKAVDGTLIGDHIDAKRNARKADIERAYRSNFHGACAAICESVQFFRKMLNFAF